MKYVMLRNKKTKRILHGTNFNYSPPHTIYADETHPPKLYSNSDNLCKKVIETEMKIRHIEKTFEPVEVEIDI